MKKINFIFSLSFEIRGDIGHGESERERESEKERGPRFSVGEGERERGREKKMGREKKNRKSSWAVFEPFSVDRCSVSF